MAEQSGPGEPDTSHLLPRTPITHCPYWPPGGGRVPAKNDCTSERTPPSGTVAAQDRETMPPKNPQIATTVNHGLPRPSRIVGGLLRLSEHAPAHHGRHRLVALPGPSYQQAFRCNCLLNGATNIYMRPPNTLLRPGQPRPRVGLMVQVPSPGPGANAGPTPQLDTYIHCSTGQTPTPANRQTPGKGRTAVAGTIRPRPAVQ